MGFALPAALIGSSLIGGLFGRKSQQNQTGTQSGTSTSTPTFGGPLSGLQDLIFNTLNKRFASGGLPAGYESLGLEGINDAYRGAGQNLNTRLVGRGLGTSPVAAAAEGNLQASRAGEQAKFIASEPLVARQLQSQDLGAAIQALGLSRGTSTTSTGTTTGAGTTTAGGGIGGGISDMGSMLGWLYGMGMLGGGGGVGGGVPPMNSIGMTGPLPGTSPYP